MRSHPSTLVDSCTLSIPHPLPLLFRHHAVLAEDAENINNIVDFPAYLNIMAEMQGLTKAFSQLPQNAGGTVSLTPEILVQVFFFSHA